MENQRSRTSIWLVNTLLAYRKLSLREINQLWLDDPDMSGGGPMTRIRLQRAISSAFDVMGVAIECDIHDRYRYYIAAKYDLKATEWMLSSQAVHQAAVQSQQLRDRVLLEEIPSGQYHLTNLITAMNQNKALQMDYQKFKDQEPVTCYVEPYCVKLSHQRWYLLACKDHRPYLQVFALDRIRQIRILHDSTFDYPADFSPREYFAHYFGVHTGGDKSLALPEPIRLKANRFWRDYLRTLPLHASQRELSAMSEYSIFGYEMVVTPDLINQLLSFGPLVEVLSPDSLRQQMRDNVQQMYSFYEEKK